MIPGEEEANAEKRLVESAVASLLKIDQAAIDRLAVDIAKMIRKSGKTPKVFITGAAGSNKSTLAASLSKELEVPAFDLDDYVKGGYTEDEKKYAHRLVMAWGAVWTDMPSNQNGWILEHVEMCHRTAVDIFKPNFAVLLSPSKSHLMEVADARDRVGDDSKGGRWRRAQETAVRSHGQFDALSTSKFVHGPGWFFKEL